MTTVVKPARFESVDLHALGLSYDSALNPFRIAQQQLDEAAAALNLEPALHELLRWPLRELHVDRTTQPGENHLPRVVFRVGKSARRGNFRWGGFGWRASAAEICPQRPRVAPRSTMRRRPPEECEQLTRPISTSGALRERVADQAL